MIMSPVRKKDNKILIYSPNKFNSLWGKWLMCQYVWFNLTYKGNRVVQWITPRIVINRLSILMRILSLPKWRFEIHFIFMHKILLLIFLTLNSRCSLYKKKNSKRRVELHDKAQVFSFYICKRIFKNKIILYMPYS